MPAAMYWGVRHRGQLRPTMQCVLAGFRAAARKRRAWGAHGSAIFPVLAHLIGVALPDVLTVRGRLCRRCGREATRRCAGLPACRYR
ncbi:hypothetical protein BCAR13_180043 [Paraburkholderia caribensis]|nr:hypothetical protein BCAR13_180043 [Paraburkholderia caribensis]